MIADTMHIGTMRITASGSVQLSYCAASTRNASSTHSGKISVELPRERISWYERSVHSKATPAGSFSRASFSSASSAALELSARRGLAR